MPKNQGHFSTIYVDSKRRHRNAHVTHGSCMIHLQCIATHVLAKLIFQTTLTKISTFSGSIANFRTAASLELLIFFHFSGPGETCK